MGTVTVTGAMIIVIGWITLVEFDSYPETERERIIKKIKESSSYILLITLMPIGIGLNVLGGFFTSYWLVVLGTFLIFVQGIIISFLLWNKRRWKSILLFIVIIILGIFVSIPLFIK